MLTNLQFNDCSRLNKTTFNGANESNFVGFSQSKTFYFNLNSNTSLNFRIAFKITYFEQSGKLSLSVSGEEKMGIWIKSNGVTNPSTRTICKWALEDFDIIISYFLKEIEKQFPSLELDLVNTTSSYVNDKIKDIKKNIEISGKYF